MAPPRLPMGVVPSLPGAPNNLVEPPRPIALLAAPSGRLPCPAGRRRVKPASPATAGMGLIR